MALPLVDALWTGEVRSREDKLTSDFSLPIQLGGANRGRKKSEDAMSILRILTAEKRPLWLEGSSRRSGSRRYHAGGEKMNGTSNSREEKETKVVQKKRDSIAVVIDGAPVSIVNDAPIPEILDADNLEATNGTSNSREEKETKVVQKKRDSIAVVIDGAPVSIVNDAPIPEILDADNLEATGDRPRSSRRSGRSIYEYSRRSSGKSLRNSLQVQQKKQRQRTSRRSSARESLRNIYETSRRSSGKSLRKKIPTKGDIAGRSSPSSKLTREEEITTRNTKRSSFGETSTSQTPQGAHAGAKSTQKTVKRKRGCLCCVCFWLVLAICAVGGWFLLGTLQKESIVEFSLEDKNEVDDKALLFSSAAEPSIMPSQYPSAVSSDTKVVDPNEFGPSDFDPIEFDPNEYCLPCPTGNCGRCAWCEADKGFQPDVVYGYRCHSSPRSIPEKTHASPQCFVGDKRVQLINQHIEQIADCKEGFAAKPKYSESGAEFNLCVDEVFCVRRFYLQPDCDAELPGSTMVTETCQDLIGGESLGYAFTKYAPRKGDCSSESKFSADIAPRCCSDGVAFCSQHTIEGTSVGDEFLILNQPTRAPIATISSAPTSSLLPTWDGFPITVTIHLDRFPKETGLTLRSLDGRVTYIDKPPGSFVKPLDLVSINLRIPPGTKVELEVTDSQGDGFEGYFQVYSDSGSLLVDESGLSFESAISKTFVVDEPETLRPTGSPVPVLDGDAAVIFDQDADFGTTLEIPFRVGPVSAGTTPVTSTPQSVDFVDLTLVLQLDQFPAETSWAITSVDDGTIYESRSVGYYESRKGESIAETFRLPEGRTYRFIIKDLMGDGFCCSEGNGYYSLSVNKSTLLFRNSADVSSAVFTGGWLQQGLTSILLKFGLKAEHVFVAASLFTSEASATSPSEKESPAPPTTSLSEKKMPVKTVRGSIAMLRRREHASQDGKKQ
ncbi:hypothetical protein THAOC_18499 [Thalassiosira oceanica]|uniref:Uncharacterized protein n=1 Tax=Thalassiosira oceanica TaxID=159749 RepID=K0SRW2_THAOC|nr:hypothetical protein THAOC_18499 [Thalassiosira oceanica]|eukprot:EJK61067.1 hypothetical protein THAOC_18499 [Thalassiosira oceanica]